MQKVIRIKKTFRSASKVHDIPLPSWLSESNVEAIDDIVSEWCRIDLSGQCYGYEYEWTIERIPKVEKTTYTFSRSDLENKLKDVMNLGMTLRQNQLSGRGGNKSGNDVLAEWWIQNIK